MINVQQFTNAKQAQAVIRAFLRAHPDLEFDGIQAARAMSQEWGIIIDWHEFSYALDILHMSGEAIITSPGDMTRYRMRKIKSIYADNSIFLTNREENIIYKVDWLDRVRIKGKRGWWFIDLDIQNGMVFLYRTIDERSSPTEEPYRIQEKYFCDLLLEIKPSLEKEST